MTPERWRKIDEVYNEALDRDLASRSPFLDQACEGDSELRREVESLLAASLRTSNAFERPAMEIAAASIAQEKSLQAGAGPAPLPALGDRYEALAEAGRGGMGVVYRVRDRETEDIIAIKVLHPEIAADPLMLERFKSELRLSRRVTHRNVCRIYDIARVGNLTFISMEFVEGESLRRVLNRLRGLNVKKGIDVIRQIAEGLREAHAQGIIHRDLKPENLMIDEAGNVKVMDFGIARLIAGTRTLIGIAGTPSYMSPEQLEGKTLDQRSDIYSLGLVVYEIFTGRAAFAGSTPVAVATLQMREPPPAPRTIDPTIPVEVEAMICRCLEKDPARRYQSLDELLTALPSPTPPSNPTPKPRPPKISDWFEETAQIMAPGKARLLLLFIQLGYLALYLAVLYHFAAVTDVLKTRFLLSHDIASLLPFTAIGGIAVRFYLFSALAFNHPATGRQYWKLFPYLLAFDAFWAASPLLLAPRLGIGVTAAMMVGMAYLPFSQKTLFSNAYR